MKNLMVTHLTSVNILLCTPPHPVNRKELTSDKGGINIKSDPETQAGKIKFTVDRLKELFTVRFHILNNGSDCIHFTYYTALHKMHCFTMEDERRVSRACPLFLCPGVSIVLCKNTHIQAERR